MEVHILNDTLIDISNFYDQDYIIYLGDKDTINLPDNYIELLIENNSDIIPIKFFGIDQDKCYRGRNVILNTNNDSLKYIFNPIKSKLIRVEIVKQILKENSHATIDYLNIALLKFAKTLSTEPDIEVIEYTSKKEKKSIEIDYSRFISSYTDLSELFKNDNIDLKKYQYEFYKRTLNKILSNSYEESQYNCFKRILSTNNIIDILNLCNGIQNQDLKLQTLKIIFEIAHNNLFK